MSEFFNWRSTSETATNCLALIERHAHKFAKLDVRAVLAKPRKDGSARKPARARRSWLSETEKAQMLEWERSGRTRKWIANELKTTEAVVSRHLRKAGIVSRTCTKANQTRARIIEAFHAGQNRYQIATSVGRSYQYVCDLLRQEGLGLWKQRIEAA